MKHAFAEIVGKDNIIDREVELERFLSDYSLIPSMKPEMAVKVHNSNEVLDVIFQLNDGGGPGLSLQLKNSFLWWNNPEKKRGSNNRSFRDDSQPAGSR